MGVYRRGKTWWYVFEFGGRKIQESSGFRNKTAALRAEAKRKTDLLERRAGFTKLKLPAKFEEFVEQFLEWSKIHHRPKTHELHKLNCQTLKRFFRGHILDEITKEMVEDFKTARKQERIKWSKKPGCYRNDRESGSYVTQASFSPGGTQRLRSQEFRHRYRVVSRATRLDARYYV
jgi:hypothetical protein